MLFWSPLVFGAAVVAAVRAFRNPDRVITITTVDGEEGPVTWLTRFDSTANELWYGETRPSGSVLWRRVGS